MESSRLPAAPQVRLFDEGIEVDYSFVIGDARTRIPVRVEDRLAVERDRDRRK